MPSLPYDMIEPSKEHVGLTQQPILYISIVVIVAHIIINIITLFYCPFLWPQVSDSTSGVVVMQTIFEVIRESL